ncbi:MAG TPA: Crp/Fnr family transcriptional regulator [Candidatus Binataceae bacterium]|nr:Crp/Fnr family transcriptional regulator [Candidatus Binataceae bacterium]
MALSDVLTPRTGVVPNITPRTDRDGDAVSNRLLASIPDEEFNALRPMLEPVDLPRYQVLYEAGAPIEYAYFVNHGMISLVVITDDGRSVEVGLCGQQEMAGTSLAFGFERAAIRAIVQLPGDGLRIPANVLLDKLSGCPQLRHMIERLVFTQQLQMAQIAACNRLHEIGQRLARWLLMCQDTAHSIRLPLTHEFIAQMLGTGRPTVTLAAGLLERAGLIESTRGAVQIVDRKRLEDAACECYAAIQNFRAGLALQ